MTAHPGLPARTRGADPLSFVEQVSLSQRRIAAYQRRVSQHALAPHETKQLRRFNLAEAAEYLPFPQDRLAAHLDAHADAPQGEKSGFGRRSFAIDEIHALRAHVEQHHPGACRRQRDPARGEQLQVLLTNNYKGGVAKTSSATMLSQYFALCGYRVLAIDLDPQGSFTTMFGIYPELHVPFGESIYAAIRRESLEQGIRRRPLAELIRKTHFPNLDIVPANIQLTDYEFDVPIAFRDGNHGTGEGVGIISSLARAIAQVEADYDLVILDTPPNLGYTTLTAVFAATGIITPLQAQMLDVASLQQFLQMLVDYVKTVSESLGVSPPILWQRYLVTMYQENRGQAAILGHLRSLLGNNVLENVMLASSAVTDATSLHCSIFEVSPEASMRRQYERAIASARGVALDVEAEILATWNRHMEPSR